MNKKIVIYQVFTRLFGNTETQLIPWGTREQNGVGKFEDFTNLALNEIKNLGVSHIWFTGVPHHALIADYTEFGISNDHPDVVKGRAGSPFAVKDYYNVNPDLAINPAKRLEEFKALIKRTHDCGLKVIIDIVPNHVARNYESTFRSEQVVHFGDTDDPKFEYSKQNDFYYIINESYQNPDWPDGYLPLGGIEENNLENYQEYPAKWTGNGSRRSKPHAFDWYETVKINYGIRPDGTKDFPLLPENYHHKSHAEHVDFWKNQELPVSWFKWRQIVDFWLRHGVDGFRYDMAELVPVEFWSYLNAYIKVKNPEVILLAEVYQPELFYDFIHLGKMDLLYDKVDMYDTLKGIIQQSRTCHDIFPITEKYHQFSERLVHFLENHDEQRIASDAFAGNPFKALPAMVLSATIDRGAVLIYFAQEHGEKAAENSGFGSPTRTSIFDYTHVPSHQRWMHHGRFDGGLSDEKEIELRAYYLKLLNFTLHSNALTGLFYDLHRHNVSNTQHYPGEKIYSFARWNDNEKILVICNFDAGNTFAFQFQLYYDLILLWAMLPGNYIFTDLFNDRRYLLKVETERAYIDLEIKPLESLILQFQPNQ